MGSGKGKTRRVSAEITIDPKLEDIPDLDFLGQSQQYWSQWDATLAHSEDAWGIPVSVYFLNREPKNKLLTGPELVHVLREVLHEMAERGVINIPEGVILDEFEVTVGEELHDDLSKHKTFHMDISYRGVTNRGYDMFMYDNEPMQFDGPTLEKIGSFFYGLTIHSRQMRYQAGWDGP